MPTKHSWKPEAAKAGPGIEKTERTRGGSARTAGTRIPVRQSVAARFPGVGDAQLLADGPALRDEDLANAWLYARNHQKEIQAEIQENEVFAIFMAPRPPCAARACRRGGPLT